MSKTDMIIMNKFNILPEDLSKLTEEQKSWIMQVMAEDNKQSKEA